MLRRRLPHLGIALAALLVAGTATSPASALCTVPSIATATASGALPRTTARLKARQPVRILAIGSSTTAGVGAGGAGFAHRLGPMVKARWPDTTVEVVVSGVSGETASGAAGRLRAELAQHQPILVVWQLGTNDANFGVSAEAFRATITAGLAAIRAANADALLVDPQYSRWAEGRPRTGEFAALIASEGARAGVPVVRRYQAMFQLAQSNRPAFDGLIAFDGLHLSAAGHDCMAQQVAGTIVRNARR
ncbi:SGNH/GDSL hydrolase family protein [Phreatobacter sp.]|uniref:SGNH/GDSL hydrolase family protein n=1 Tax=Phreatobacter sp. TaxID=1966341 RepID=UPI0022BC58C9|nr:SGNH/GDSL hydrolase family protein [Phreatobacter sp.]MCZ8315839.1 SGNH/GDSL hydrolase family protein [Phreatobacter sp.]